jgi:hypothetical protein
MRAAAADLEADAIVARLFDRVPAPPGSVPQLRLLAALHHLVLCGRARELEGFYPSVGGTRSPEGVWGPAVATIEEHFRWIRARLHRTVQTNEPGRSAVLYGALLWLSEYHRRPIGLLEIGASAGLNLIPDRYRYVVAGAVLGDPASAVCFQEPWDPAPPVDIRKAAAELQLVHRAGCDLSPLDPSDPEDRVTLLSYIWPDETPRIERMRAALDAAAASPPPVSSLAASNWLPEALDQRPRGTLTVIWHSLFRQYVEPAEWTAIENAIQSARADPDRPVAWLSMEPGEDHLAHVSLVLRGAPEESDQPLAECGDHGPPVRWRA